MGIDKIAMWFLFTIGMIVPQIIVVGLLLGRWIHKYPTWKEN